MKFDKRDIRSILFMTLTNLGDVILTTPVLEKLHDEFPDAHVDVVTGPAGKEVFSGHPVVREVIVYNKRASMKEKLSQFFSLRGKGYDLAVDLKRSLMPYLVGARSCAGALSFPGPFPARRKALHKKKEHLLILEGLGVDALKDNRFFIPVTDADKDFADGLISGKGSRNVVLVPGAKSHLKRWDTAKYAALADMLVSELDCRVFICGNEDDREVVGRVLSNVRSPVTDLCGKTSIGALSELMRRSSLVITNDSAPLHVASSVNAPTIALFGPSDEKKYGPLAKKSRVIKPDVPCRPCGRALCAIGPDEGCLSRVETDEVFKAAKEMIWAD